MIDTVKTEAKKPIIFSGIKPTGEFQLGNYIGALKNWKLLEDDYRCIYSVVDMHAITVKIDKAALRANSYTAAAVLLAIGLDPAKSLIFLQSHVPAHAELAWVLGCHSMFGELNRMTQFKDKSKKNADNINAGLFTYPVLMAADILLYKTNLVPVGHDQKQHLELARNIAERFNGVYGNVFTVPDGYIPKIGARIMMLSDPTSKMSKSEGDNNGCVFMLDKPEDIMRKFKRAITDSDAEVIYSDDKPGIKNLMTIYNVATGRDYAAIEREFAGRGYGDFKIAVGESVVEMLRPVREEYSRLISDKAYLESVLKQGASAAETLAKRTLSKVYDKVGFIL